MYPKSTEELEDVLSKTQPDHISAFLETYADSIVSTDKPFADYIRECLRRKNLKQQEVFLRAEISERYGYKLVSEEKRTRQRDYILRICYAARLTLEETQRALTLYGMASLYPRIARDAVLMIAFKRGIYDIQEINRLLQEHNMEPLRSSKGVE